MIRLNHVHYIAIDYSIDLIVAITGRSGAGVGVGMLRGRRFIGFLVSWFQSFLVSWFFGFLASWSQSIKELPNVNFMSSGRYWSRIQELQEVVNRIFMIGRCPLFQHFKVWDCLMCFPVAMLIQFPICCASPLSQPIIQSSSLFCV